MRSYQLIVVGSGPAGVSAAAAYLQQGGQGPVLLVSSDRDQPYERPPLSKESLRDSHNPQPTPLTEAELPDEVETRLGTTVSRIDLGQRTLDLGGETVAFEQLILSPGSEPVPLSGADDDAQIDYLRHFSDLQGLHADVGHARTALVIGSGFIGCEAAISLAMRGLEVTMVTPERAPQEKRLGEVAAQLIESLVRSYGVAIRTGVSVTSVEAPRTVHLNNGETLSPDVILAAIGIAPATGFLDDSGLQLYEGRIVVDDRMQTATEGVFAAGDAARAVNALIGRPVVVEHWGDALGQGEVAGKVAAGDPDAVWDQVPGFWTDLGEHTLQYAAWGDGFDATEAVEEPGRLTVWYGLDGELVGVLAYNADDDYEAGRELIAKRVPFADRPR